MTGFTFMAALFFVIYVCFDTNKTSTCRVYSARGLWQAVTIVSQCDDKALVSRYQPPPHTHTHTPWGRDPAVSRATKLSEADPAARCGSARLECQPVT